MKRAFFKTNAGGCPKSGADALVGRLGFIKKPTRASAPQSASGFTLMEALVLVMILAIVGAGTGRALQSLVRSPENNDVQFQLDMALVNEMEKLRAMSFDKLVVGTYTNDIAIYQTTYPMNIVVALDNSGAGDAKQELKNVTVTLAGRTMATLVCKP